jgi:hypothetical protein
LETDGMTAPSFWEVLDRAWNTGAPTKTRDFDMKIFTEATRLAEEHGISYDPSTSPATTASPTTSGTPGWSCSPRWGCTA